LRVILNAIFYVLRTGCPWRYLPLDMPPWPSGHYSFRKWRDDGTWAQVTHALRRQERVRQGRDPDPSALIIDSQSVKTTEKGDSAAMTAASPSKAASARFWSTPSAS
jgi:transposase